MSQTSSSRSRVPSGIPTGGQFATTSHDESDVDLFTVVGEADVEVQSGGDPLPTPVGTAAEKIPVAEARRALPVGSRVQVLYLNRRNLPEEPIVREVTKQTAYEMTTALDGRPAHLQWARQQTERDASGLIIVRDEDGTPYVAYRPLADGDPEPTETSIRVHPGFAVRADEARGSSDPVLLEEISQSPLAYNRMLVAENPASAVGTLDRLSLDDHVKVRRNVASNPNTSTLALHRLASDADEAAGIGIAKVRWRVASNPNTSAVALRRLADDEDPSVRTAVGRHASADPRVLRHLGTTPRPGQKWVDRDIRTAVASNPNTPSDVLATWEKSDGWTMPQVAANPSTPADVLERLAGDTSTGNQTRAQVAVNPSAPSHLLHRLARDEDRWVREHAAKNPNVGPDNSARLALDKEPRVRRALAGNPAADPSVLSRLQADPDTFVRSSLARNPSLRPETLQALANDGHHAVRAGVAQNPNTPRSTLERLATEEGNVGDWAHAVLRSR